MVAKFENSSYSDIKKYKEYRKRNKETERRRKNQFINSYKTPCLFCGSDENVHFHHVNPLEKEFEVSTGKYRSYKNIEKEIYKCWCLCSECHIKLHNRLCDPLPSCYDSLNTVYHMSWRTG